MNNEDKPFDQNLFNEQQQEIITQPLGAHCIVAGAGTGKTRVLTSRIRYAIEQFHIAPNRILAITFTNKAAGEIADRIRKNIPGIRFGWVNTFHSFCRKFLIEEIENLDRDKNFSIVDEEDKSNIIRVIYKENLIEKDLLSVKAMTHILEIKKGFGVSCEEAINTFYNDPNYATNRVEKTRIVRLVVDKYENYLWSNNLVDFNDLLLFTHTILKNFSSVREKWQNNFDYVFVDEFQDVNKIQYEIVAMIAQKKRNIFVVGDSDQSIYTWRGANPNIELTFQRDFPETKILLLEQNYRSTKKILDVANDLIKNNKGRIPKKLFTSKKSQQQVVYYGALSQNDEAEWIVDKICELAKEKKEFHLQDITILYRSNYWSRALEQELIKHNIAYVIYGGVKFYQRREIKDILAYIRTIIFKNDLNLLRIINVPSRKIGEKSLMAVKQFAREQNISIYDALVRHNEIKQLIPSVHRAIDRFFDELKTIEKRSDMQFDRIVNTIVDVVNYKDSLDDNIKFRLQNLDQLSQAMMTFKQKNPNDDLADFLNEISLFTDFEQADKNTDRDAVKLMTVHTSKGLEFPCVFIAGLVEGVFPSRHSLENNNLGSLSEMEEERRILYVAVTRAMNNLYLTSCGGYNYISEEEMTVSRFVSEIDPKNLSVITKSLQPIMSNYTDNDHFFDSHQKNFDHELYDFNVNIKVGEVIVHKQFGSGIVTKVEGPFIAVKFDHFGKKTLLKNHRSIIRKLS